MTDDRRRRGLQRMAEVYGWPPVAEPAPHDAFTAMTADHLFAEVWTRPPLTTRDRRLLLLGALAAAGDIDVVALQLDAAHRLGELGAEELREIVIFLTHYVGWPRGAKLNAEVEKLLARQRPERT